MKNQNQVIFLLGIILLLFIFSDKTNAMSKATQFDNTHLDIVISPYATKQETKAADQLAAYLQKLYPTYQISVKTAMNKVNFTVRIGLPSFISPGEPVSGEIPSNEEGFLIRRQDEKNVIIVSLTAKGLFNAVYSLIEKLGYGFYLSYEGKSLQKKELIFKEWELSDYPLQPERIVFNWHNFLSGCTGWNYEDWCSWIDQSAKMRYNSIMVHAYGNNPMFSFEYNGMKKGVGYLTTSASGRDWGAQHINDVRRLPGGKVFSSPVLGSTASLVPDEWRGDAVTKLMSKVFEYAAEMAMKVNFAIDVDTWSANPRNIIESLPVKCRIKLEKQDIVNPETADDYQYYKAQVKSLLTSYPQISTITIWVRPGNTLWRDIRQDQFPKSWQTEWNQLHIKHPEIERDKFSPSTFAFSKIVIAYQKALKEIKREDVIIAFGSWSWEFMASANVLMPSNCTLIPLDSGINFDTDETKKLLSDMGRQRKVIPIVWAQHDDHRYMGKPYTPFTNFNDLLRERNAAGFGIIHWTTRPLDLLFKSLADQVWSVSANKNIASTILDYSRTIFGQQKDALYDYMTEWIGEGPMFGRETTEHFFDLGKQISGEKYEPTGVTIERIKRRMGILKKVDQSKLSDMGRKVYNYYSAMEQFYLSLFQNQDKFYKAYEMLGRQSIDSAKVILHTTSPDKTIELFADASVILPITAGEKALIMSMGTRWLPDFINLEQRARMNEICYKFEATQHDSLAQLPGTGTYFIDSRKILWSCMGTRELKTGFPGSFDKRQAGGIPENALTYMKISAPFMLPLVTIGKNLLTPGKYKVEIKYVTSSPYGSDCKLFLVSKNKHTLLQTVAKNSGSKLKAISSIIELKDPEKYAVEVDPGFGNKQFTNLVIKPLR